MGGLQEFGVGPAYGAVASAPGDGDFAGWARVVLEIFEEVLAGHGGCSVAYSWRVWEWWWDTIAGFGSLRMGAKRGGLKRDPSTARRATAPQDRRDAQFALRGGRQRCARLRSG